MKIFFLITKSTEGGAQTHITQLSRALIERGDSVAVMSAPGGWLEKEITALGGQFFPNTDFKNSYNPLILFRGKRGIEKVLKDFAPDIVSCHSGFAGLVGRLTVRNTVPTIFTAHGWSFSPGSPLKQRIATLLVELFAAQWAKKIICVSEYDRQLALRYHVADSNKLLTVHNGVEIPVEFPRKRTSLKNILFIGRLVGQKRPLDVLHAATLLPEEVLHTIKIFFAGGGPLQESLESFAAENNIKDRVLFLGNIHRTKVLELLEEADLFVLPTNYEGLPRSVLEAFAQGVPVLASGVSGIPELIQGNVGHILTPGNEPKEISEHILAFKKEPDLLKHMGENAYERAKNHFSLEKMVEKTLAVYDGLLVRKNNLERF